MNRVRFINGNLHTFLDNIKIAERAKLVELAAQEDINYTCVDISISEATKVAVEQMLHPQDSASYSGMDPASMANDAMGRLAEIPAQHVARAEKLCQMERWGGAQLARFTPEGDPNHDIVIAEGKRGVTVFVREYQGRKAMTCFKCENAESRGQRPMKHSCYRRYTHDHWQPQLFINCTSLDAAEEVANELRSAYSGTAEQEVEGWGNELPFSNDYIAGYVAARPSAAIFTQD